MPFRDLRPPDGGYGLVISGSILSMCPPHGGATRVDKLLRRRFHMQLLQQTRDRAQGLVEYGLIIALVAVLAIAGLVIFGPAVSSLLSKLGGSV